MTMFILNCVIHKLKDFKDRCESPLVHFTDDGYVDADKDVLTSETHVMMDAEIKVHQSFKVLWSCCLFQGDREKREKKVTEI